MVEVCDDSVRLTAIVAGLKSSLIGAGDAGRAGKIVAITPERLDVLLKKQVVEAPVGTYVLLANAVSRSGCVNARLANIGNGPENDLDLPAGNVSIDDLLTCAQHVGATRRSEKVGILDDGYRRISRAPVEGAVVVAAV